MRPYCELPVPHFCSLKLSTNELGIAAFAFALVFGAFAFALAVTLLLRFSLRVLAFRLILLLFEPRLASATSITTTPMPITNIAASPPSTHQTALDFFRGGAAVGGGVHCGGGGGDAGVVGRGLTTCGCGR